MDNLKPWRTVLAMALTIFDTILLSNSALNVLRRFARSTSPEGSAATLVFHNDVDVVSGCARHGVEPRP